MEQEQAYEQLNEKYKLAIDMRLEHVTYKDIAQKIGNDEGTVRNWFARTGLCHTGFHYKKKLRKKDRKELFKQIDDKLKDMANDAIFVLAQAIKKGNVKAAIDVLQMVGFEPIHKFEDVTPKSNSTISLLKEILKNHDTNAIKPLPDKRPADHPDSPPADNI